MLLHTADVLVMERRCCSLCGCSVCAPSPKVHMLFHSVVGDPRKVALVPRKPEDTHHITRSIHYVEVEVPSCETCWAANAAELVPYAEAEAFTPERPPTIVISPLAKPTAAKPARPPSIEELV